MLISDWSSDVCSSDLDDVDRCADRLGVGDLRHAEVADGGTLETPAMVGDDPPLLVGLGIIDDQLEEETVELRLGQRIDALLFDRILRREHGEARTDRKSTRLNSSH